LRGWPGAITASLAFIVPAAALMTLVAAGSLILPDQPWVRGALIGIQVAVTGVLVSAMVKLARSEARDRWLAATIVASCALGFFLHAAIVVVGAGLIGAALGAGRADE
jgi:chromate transport protein ChrA